MNIERIERISGGKLALIVSREELETGGSIDMEKAHAMAEEAFERNGLVLAGKVHMELEAFSGAGTVLIFASLLRPDHYACRFESFDDLVQAAQSLDMKDVDAELICLGESYIALGDASFPWSISEFGQLFSLDPEQRAWLREHGRLLSQSIFGRLSDRR